MPGAQVGYELLRHHIGEECRKLKVDGTDTFDADFLLGLIMEWLEKHDAVLTKEGVMRTQDSP